MVAINQYKLKNTSLDKKTTIKIENFVNGKINDFISEISANVYRMINTSFNNVDDLKIETDIKTNDNEFSPLDAPVVKRNYHNISEKHKDLLKKHDKLESKQASLIYEIKLSDFATEKKLKKKLIKLAMVTIAVEDVKKELFK